MGIARWKSAWGVILFVVASWAAAPAFAGDATRFVRGDSNDDGRYDISDGINILNWLFLGSGLIDCDDAADVNDSGTHDLTDGVYVFNGLFGAGAMPPEPFDACGVDPTADGLGCDRFDQCDQTAEPPTITSVIVSPVTRESAVVTVATDLPTTAVLDYGLDAGYGLRVESLGLGFVHGFEILGLDPATVYHFQVTVEAEDAQTAQTADATFETAPAESDLTKIGHVLNRAAYGPTADEIARMQDIGIRNWLEEQLEPGTIDESTNDDLISREDALFTDLVVFHDTPIVRPNEVWRFFRGTAEPSPTAGGAADTAWTELGFDDAAWELGATGIGYGDGDDLTVLEDMRRREDDPETPEIDESQPGYVSVYLRKTFFVADVAAIDELVLRIDYDDGFVAYLNGTEVARSGLSGSPPPFDRTSSSHEAGSAVDFDITSRKGLLQDGSNTLAIQVHNTNPTSSDLTMIPSLVSRETEGGPPRKVIDGVDALQKLVHVRGTFARRQLQAVLGEFWENHFTTDVEKLVEYFDALQNSDATDAMTEAQAIAEAAQLEYEEYQFFHDNALGNFGDLLLYSATSVPMLVYLDSVLNIAGAANENYAREIFELHGFGVDNGYMQTDIEQLSKCFTGWSVCKVEPGDKAVFPLSATDPPADCGVQFEDTTFLDLGAGWRYFKGTEEPSPGAGGEATTTWSTADFDDSGWLPGSTGIGYGDGDDATVLSDMQGNYYSVYLRREFTVADPLNAFDNLILSIDYDDGYVAYLNGVEVGRSETMEDEGNPPAFDQDADDTHEVDDPGDQINLNAFLGLLRPAPATNVLAIQVHNASLGSSDLSCLPRLIDREILPGSVENGDPGAVWTFRFDPDLHDATEKVLFNGTPFRMVVPAGRTGPEGVRDALDVIDAIVDHPSTAEFICIKLIQKFVSDEISLASFDDGTAPIELRELLADMIAAWNSTTPRGNIETVMRVVLDAEDQTGVFWSDLAYRSKVKTPIEMINSSLRLLESSADGDELPGFNSDMGMALFTRDEPDGYSELGVDWMDTASMLERIDFVQELSENRDGDFAWDTLSFLDKHGISSAQDIVDFFADVAFHGTLSEANKSLLLEFLTTDDNGNPRSLTPGAADYRRRVEEFVGLVLSMPQWHFQ